MQALLPDNTKIEARKRGKGQRGRRRGGSGLRQMAKGVKDIMAEMLAEWLFKDFGILIDEPTEKDIAETLEEHEKEMLENGVKKR